MNTAQVSAAAELARRKAVGIQTAMGVAAGVVSVLAWKRPVLRTVFAGIAIIQGIGAIRTSRLSTEAITRIAESTLS